MLRPRLAGRLDEPCASVDAVTKIHLEQLLLEVWTETPSTCVFVDPRRPLGSAR